MANVRDSDTSLWLHNKLGTSNDSWTGGSICSQLNGEVLRNIKDCFPDLQTQVKLKLLLSFFHIQRKHIEDWRLELEQIIDVAVGDSELWVSMLAEALKTFPASGSLNTEISDLDEVRPIFTDLISGLKPLVRKQSENGMLPMECHYLNKGALVSVVGQQPIPVKHFTLKKKPKSAVLRADLLQKSTDAVSNLKKSSAPVIPVRSRGMPRKMTDTTPLKGIPSRVPSSGFRSGALNSNLASRPPLSRPAAGRKEGGVKLLDIADQPLGYAAAKKRKKLEQEEAKKSSDVLSGLQSPPGATGASTGGADTPDYAAGLTAPSYAPATPQPVISGASVAGSTTTSNAVSSHTQSQQILTDVEETPIETDTSNNATATSDTTDKAVPTPPPTTSLPTTTTAVKNPTPTPSKTVILSTAPSSNTGVAASVASLSAIAPVPTLIQTKPYIVKQSMPAGKVTTAVITVPVSAATVAAQTRILATLPGGSATQTVIQQYPVAVAPNAQTIVRAVPPLIATIAPMPVAPTTPIVFTRKQSQVIRMPTQQPTALKRSLALTREQMIEAQEMFRTANKVTRPEKALILGFMAGSRDNPCPHLGNVVTIKLSEAHENVMQSDNRCVPMLAETHFQMNYNTGEWQRIKKYRHIETSVDQLSGTGGHGAAAGLV